MESLENNFRKLRESWFNRHLHSWPHERIDESEEDERSRNDQNKELKKIYDEDTEAIIAGKSRCVDPTCQFDIDKGRK